VGVEGREGGRGSALPPVAEEVVGGGDFIVPGGCSDLAGVGVSSGSERKN